MDTNHQYVYFLLSVGIGIVGGMIYEIFAFFRFVLCSNRKRRTIGAVVDVLFFCAFALFAIWAAHALRFPSFREYMWIGYLLGGIIYLKTLHRIVAFWEKVCYNVLAKLVKKAKKAKKLSEKGD